MGKMEKATLVDMANIFKAIAHNERLSILIMLCQNKRTVKSLYDALGLQQAIVSRHLAILKNAGIVQREQDGQKVYYSLCFEKKKIMMLAKCLC